MKQSRHKKHARASSLRSRAPMLIAALILLALIGIGGWFAWERYRATEVALQAIFAQVATVETYSQHVVTNIAFPDRQLTISGIYHINTPEKRFWSVATTTLTVPSLPHEEKTHSFTLHNISIDRDVYTKVETDSEVLQATIPHSRDWKHFTNTTIPPQFENISIPGAIMDNLRIFDDNGEYLSFQEHIEADTTHEEPYTLYVFTPSGARPAYIGGSLNALLDRIGPDGRMEVWVDETDMVRHMRFSNDTYTSTTSISDINNIPLIQAPSTGQ